MNPSISIPVTKLRVDEEIRMDNEESFSKRLYNPYDQYDQYDQYDPHDIANTPADWKIVS